MTDESPAPVSAATPTAPIPVKLQAVKVVNFLKVKDFKGKVAYSLSNFSTVLAEHASQITSALFSENRPRRKGASAEKPSLAEQAAIERKRFKTWMQGAISFIALAAALFIILSSWFADDAQKWAYGIVGTIIGFWLKG